jgi:hypothetical protein
MQVQKYLREHGLQKLQDEFAFKVKVYDEGLIVLNYNQIDSPKSHPITVECRALILDSDFNVVSRSFDRFFNLGEVPESQAHIDMQKATLHEKIDGSLIRIYFWNDKWNIATRGMAFAESAMNGFDITFRELVLKALDVNEQTFQYSCEEMLDKDTTYICEITSVENRCVKAYTGYNLHYLAARNNKTFEFINAREVAREFGMCIPERYSFETIEACQEVVKTLKNLDEGYVMYQDGVPVCKIKSPAYCAVHLLRGEGLNPKRISELVLTNEQEEYLIYFPEDRSFVQPYVDKLVQIHQSLELAWLDNHGIESQKDFAIAIKSVKGNSVLFTARKLGITVHESWKLQTDAFKLRTLMEAMV